MPGAEEVPLPEWVLLGTYLVLPNAGCLRLSDYPQHCEAATHCFDDWGIPWVGTPPSSQTRDALNLTSDRLQAIQHWHDEAFENGVEWPNIFWTAEDAAAYRDHFFAGFTQARTLTLSCDISDCDDLAHELRPRPLATGQCGMFKAASQRRSAREDTGNAYVGYDVFGLELGGRLHSLAEFDFWTRQAAVALDIKPNSYGHLTTWDDAKEAEKLANAIEGGLDGIPWFAMRVTAD